ncbi:unnamed protein product [Lasius platythorax]|uniref:Uncharacterized protein n=1 Tax=Lasius platythorax TaxID=488582 RepID=A0AAV2PBV6_9HYME
MANSRNQTNRNPLRRMEPAFLRFRARNIPTASPLFSSFATHLRGIPRVAPVTRLYSRSFCLIPENYSPTGYNTMTICAQGN